MTLATATSGCSGRPDFGSFAAGVERLLSRLAVVRNGSGGARIAPGAFFDIG